MKVGVEAGPLDHTAHLVSCHIQHVEQPIKSIQEDYHSIARIMLLVEEAVGRWACLLGRLIRACGQLIRACGGQLMA